MEQQHGSAVLAGQTETTGFGERAVSRNAETSAIAVAEQSKASVQARWVMALQRPRDLMRARQTLLADCKRLRFAETAIYNKPIGQGVKGPSIRMAEAAARALGNILCECATIYDDTEKRIARVTTTDLESNATYWLDVTLAKTIERTRPMEGRKIHAVRKNSRNQDVFVIEATDDEILDRERALVSKAMRTCLLRLVPGDLLEEALEQCEATRRGDVKADPKAAVRKMTDAFQSLGFSAAHLAEYLGHAVDTATIEEIDSLRGLFNALREKEVTWAEAMEARKAERAVPAEVVDDGRSQADALGERLLRKATGGNKPATAEGAPKA